MNIDTKLKLFEQTVAGFLDNFNFKQVTLRVGTRTVNCGSAAVLANKAIFIEYIRSNI